MEAAKNFLTGTGVDALFQYFKEYAAKWILKSLNLNPDGFLGSIFITSIGNLPIGDILKLTDCNYAVPYFTKSIVEGMIRKFLVSKGYENPITATVRNALTEVMEDTEFVKNLQGKLLGLLCPMWQGLAKKMDKVGEKLADKAQGPSISSSGLKSSAENLMSKTNDAMSKASDMISQASSVSDMASEIPITSAGQTFKG